MQQQQQQLLLGEASRRLGTGLKREIIEVFCVSLAGIGTATEETDMISHIVCHFFYLIYLSACRLQQGAIVKIPHPFIYTVLPSPALPSSLSAFSFCISACLMLLHQVHAHSLPTHSFHSFHLSLAFPNCPLIRAFVCFLLRFFVKGKGFC